MDGQKDHVPVYRRLVDHYRNRICSYEIKPGARIDSISRIMERHRVSRETAKLVLKKLVEQGLVTSIRGKGTFVNFHEETKPAWGVVIPFLSSNIEQLISELAIQAEAMKRTLNYFLHYNNPAEEIRITGDLVRSGYEAVIVIPNYDESKTADFYRRLVTGKSKVILADNTMAGSFFNYVIQSYDLGVTRAFEYLCQKVKGNYLLLGDETWKGRNMVFDLISDTFRFLVQSRCPGRRLFVVQGLGQVDASFMIRHDISGILALQDSDAVRITGRMKRWNIAVPGKVSVVSYGNTELTACFDPGITAIDCNYGEMAQQIRRITADVDHPDKMQVVISPELIIRET